MIELHLVSLDGLNLTVLKTYYNYIWMFIGGLDWILDGIFMNSFQRRTFARYSISPNDNWVDGCFLGFYRRNLGSSTRGHFSHIGDNRTLLRSSTSVEQDCMETTCKGGIHQFLLSIFTRVNILMQSGLYVNQNIFLRTHIGVFVILIRIWKICFRWIYILLSTILVFVFQNDWRHGIFDH